MEKPVDVRGFGFKLDGGRTQDRPIYISAVEEGLKKMTLSFFFVDVNCLGLFR